MKTGRYHPIVTDTTRPPRVNNGVLEQDGVEYFFRTEQTILDDLRNGQFIEAAIIHNQQVSGVRVREIEKAKNEGKIAITDIEPVGAHNVMQAKPNTTAIFLLPPSFDEWLSRLKKRNPHMTDEELRRRLTSAAKEFRMALDHDYYTLIINDNLQKATEQVDELARNSSSSELQANQPAARKLLQELLAKTEARLAA
jgi:guanylate kinase